MVGTSNQSVPEMAIEWGFPKMVIFTPKWMLCEGKKIRNHPHMNVIAVGKTTDTVPPNHLLKNGDFPRNHPAIDPYDYGHLQTW